MILAIKILSYTWFVFCTLLFVVCAFEPLFRNTKVTCTCNQKKGNT